MGHYLFSLGGESIDTPPGFLLYNNIYKLLNNHNSMLSKKSKELLGTAIKNHPIFKNKNYKIYMKLSEDDNVRTFLDCYNLLYYAYIKLKIIDDKDVGEEKLTAAEDIGTLLIFKFDINKLKTLYTHSLSNYDKLRYKLLLESELDKDRFKVDEVINVVTELQPFGYKPETPYKTFGVPLDKFEDEKDLYEDVEGDDNANAPI